MLNILKCIGTIVDFKLKIWNIKSSRYKFNFLRRILEGTMALIQGTLADDVLTDYSFYI